MSLSKPILSACVQWMDDEDKESEPPSEVDNLAAMVQGSSIDPDCNAMCEEMILSLVQKGAAG